MKEIGNEIALTGIYYYRMNRLNKNVLYNYSSSSTFINLNVWLSQVISGRKEIFVVLLPLHLKKFFATLLIIYRDVF